MNNLFCIMKMSLNHMLVYNLFFFILNSGQISSSLNKKNFRRIVFTDSMFDFIHREHSEFLRVNGYEPFDPWLRGCWHPSFDPDLFFQKIQSARLPLDSSRLYAQPVSTEIVHDKPILDDGLKNNLISPFEEKGISDFQILK